jgi:hypothetical protein
MQTCDHDGCAWRAVAPSAAAAREQYARHLIDAHGSTTETSIPPGYVEVRCQETDEWQTVTLEEAKRLHARHHGRGG